MIVLLHKTAVATIVCGTVLFEVLDVDEKKGNAKDMPRQHEGICSIKI